MSKQDNYVRYTLRVPRDLYEAIAAAAGEHSINAEIVQRLAKSQGERRDWFAGQALTGLMAYPGDNVSGNWHNNASSEGVAARCYELADAMIAARGEPK